jgi:hypothetical protein
MFRRRRLRVRCASVSDSPAQNRVLAGYGEADGCEQRYPEVHDGYDLLGMVYEARGEPGRAADCYRKVIASGWTALTAAVPATGGLALSCRGIRLAQLYPNVSIGKERKKALHRGGCLELSEFALIKLLDVRQFASRLPRQGLDSRSIG